MHFVIGKALGLMLAAACVAGCGQQTTSGPDPDGRQTTSASGCPLSVEDLSKATALTWQLRERKDNHPLENAESIKATVCLYTTADAPQDASDPLVLRADVVTGKDAATIRKDFTDTCTEFGGQVSPSASAPDAVVCTRDGSVVEGIVGDDARVVNVYFVNADKTTATKLTPGFDKVLAATR